MNILVTIFFLCMIYYIFEYLFDNYEYFTIDRNAIASYINQNTNTKYKHNQIISYAKQVEIPLDIYMVWHTDIPPIMQHHLNKSIEENDECNFHIYNVDDCRKFIKFNFNEDVLNAFDALTPIAYKIDLWRYCVIYKNGGIYVDIKMFPVNGFKYIHLVDREYFVLERDGKWWKNDKFGICNAFIIAKAGNKILGDCIKKIVENVKIKNYDRNALYPTGPGLLGDIYFEYNENYDDIELFFIGIIDGIYYIKHYDKVILQSYPEYNIERLNGGQKSYYDLYLKKNIYN